MSFSRSEAGDSEQFPDLQAVREARPEEQPPETELLLAAEGGQLDPQLCMGGQVPAASISHTCHTQAKQRCVKEPLTERFNPAPRDTDCSPGRELASVTQASVVPVTPHGVSTSPI